MRVPHLGPALAGVALLGLLAGPVAAQPTVQYQAVGDRQIIFVNNPERLEVGYTDTVPGSATFGATFSDLADKDYGRKTILDQPVEPGRYRNVFEHVWNARSVSTGPAAANPIHYGVYVYNPNSTAVTVTLNGKAFTNSVSGAIPYAERFNGEDAGNPSVVYQVPARNFVWLLRTDVDYGGLRPINLGSFFSGIVDFEVAGGPCVVSNIAYQDFFAANSPQYAGSTVLPATLLGRPDYMGFLYRRYAVPAGAAPESRVYKGLMRHPSGVAVASAVRTSSVLSFTINDSTPVGELTVTYPTYTANSTGLFVPSATNFTGPSWTTHNVPIRDTATVKTVANDMFDIVQPGYGTLYALFQSNTPNTPFGQSNFGNWGVVYQDRISVTNNGTSARTVAINLGNPGTGGSPVAYKVDNGTWQTGNARSTGTPLVPVTFHTFSVPGNSTRTVDFYFSLGCPGVGTIRHSVAVTNAATP
jgi:hypothetical protein